MLTALLVDDEELVLRMMTRVFEKAGFAVVTASSARAGKTILSQSAAFDAVVTDLNMESPLAGYEVVRAANRLAPRPVIALFTAFPVPPADWQAAGADVLCPKDLTALSLPEQLKALLEQTACC